MSLSLTLLLIELFKLFEFYSFYRPVFSNSGYFCLFLEPYSMKEVQREMERKGC